MDELRDYFNEADEPAENIDLNAEQVLKAKSQLKEDATLKNINASKALRQALVEIETADSADAVDLTPELKQAARERCEESIAKQRYHQRRLLGHLWLVACMGFVGTSFVLPQYFLQMLLLALLCGAKWLLRERQAHTNIQIYHQADKQEERLLKKNSRIDKITESKNFTGT